MLKRILNLSLAFILMLSIASVQFTSAESNKIYVLVSGINEGEVSAPVVKDNINMFPIGQILSLTDITGGETVNRNTSPMHSFVTFRGACYKFTDGETNVTEYVVDESGDCFELTGQTYHLEKAVICPNDSDGAFVPLSFIERIILEALDKDIEFNNENMTIARFDYKRSQSCVFGNQEALKRMRELEKAQAASKGLILALKINSPWLLTDDDGGSFDDNNHNVTPIIRNGSTLLPIAPIIERLGGTTSGLIMW